VARTLLVPHPSPRTVQRAVAALWIFARAMAVEHALALHAMAKVTLPRRNVSEVRAMYLPHHSIPRSEHP